MSSLIIKFSVLLEHLILMGRNSRWPNKANHGSRPCSSVMRRMRKDGFYQRPRAEGTAGVDIATDDDNEAQDEDEEEEEGGTKTAEGTAQPDAASKDAGGAQGKDAKAPQKDAKSPPAKETKAPEKGKAKGK